MCKHNSTSFNLWNGKQDENEEHQICSECFQVKLTKNCCAYNMDLKVANKPLKILAGNPLITWGDFIMPKYWISIFLVYQKINKPKKKKIPIFRYIATAYSEGSTGGGWWFIQSKANLMDHGLKASTWLCFYFFFFKLKFNFICSIHELTMSRWDDPRRERTSRSESWGWNGN